MAAPATLSVTVVFQLELPLRSKRFVSPAFSVVWSALLLQPPTAAHSKESVHVSALKSVLPSEIVEAPGSPLVLFQALRNAVLVMTDVFV